MKILETQPITPVLLGLMKGTVGCTKRTVWSHIARRFEQMDGVVAHCALFRCIETEDEFKAQFLSLHFDVEDE